MPAKTFPLELKDCIKIDMDYSADPIWVTNSLNRGWVNGCLDDLKPYVPKTFLHAMEVYRVTWEILSSSKYQSMCDDPDYESNALKNMEHSLLLLTIDLGKELKTFVPEKRIFISVLENDDQYSYVNKEFVFDENKEIILIDVEE
ncbi:TPA: hypothetical protein NV714_001782 [Escherichia coli]|nr:hypothetical protein [Escherichia coli]